MLLGRQSLVAEDGAITFRCQHGPPECKANAVHACVAKHVTADRRRLDLVKCMINANSMKSDPIEVGRKVSGESVTRTDASVFLETFLALVESMLPSKVS